VRAAADGCNRLRRTRARKCARRDAARPAKEKRGFAHNSLSAFREALEWAREKTEGREEGSVFIALDAVYSMDGDVAPLREMMDIADETLEIGRALFMVDEAHATGVIGPEGRGLVCALGLEERVFTRVVTFGKSLACSGGEAIPSHGGRRLT
jgi:8-amino-7-oxononanoate synthase